MITLICLIVFGKMPHQVLGWGRFIGLLILEFIILYGVLK